MFKSLRSAAVNTNNVLLKITVPKRTGLKRKKHSHDPFQGIPNNEDDSGQVKKGPQHGAMTRDTQSLIRSLRDNHNKYQVQVIGPIGRTHRFRGIPSSEKGQLSLY